MSARSNVGFTPEQAAAVEVERVRSQDEETAGFIRLARRAIVPRLIAAGWQCRYDGEDGIGCYDWPKRGRRLIHSIARERDGFVWAHVSVSRFDRVLPTWEQTRDAWWLCYDQLPGIIVVAPRALHVDLGEVAHVWGCLTHVLIPDFTRGLGTI